MENQIPLTRVERLAAELLRDRTRQAERAKQKPSRPMRERTDLIDPFDQPFTRVLVGADPGYLVRTPMRMGSVGFHIPCQACGNEFESKGWRYCPTCMDIPADERREMRPSVQGRICQGPGCEKFIPRKARADVRFCSNACRARAKREKRVRGAKNVTANRSALPHSHPPQSDTDNGQKVK